MRTSKSIQVLRKTIKGLVPIMVSYNEYNYLGFSEQLSVAPQFVGGNSLPTLMKTLFVVFRFYELI